MGSQFLTLIPVDGFFIYFSIYMYCTVFSCLGIGQGESHMSLLCKVWQELC